MENLDFSRPGNFYRGNMHTHSTNSDGSLSPEAVCGAYRGEGHDFLVLTDHFMEVYGFPVTDTRSYRTGYFTTIIGAELHAPEISGARSGTSSRSACLSISSRSGTPRPARRSRRP